MTFSLGWQKRDENDEKQRIDFELIRDKATWRVQHGRFNTREEFTPTEEDWETLFETLDRHLARGKVSHLDYKLVSRIRRDGK